MVLTVELGAVVTTGDKGEESGLEPHAAYRPQCISAITLEPWRLVRLQERFLMNMGLPMSAFYSLRIGITDEHYADTLDYTELNTRLPPLFGGGLDPNKIVPFFCSRWCRNRGAAAAVVLGPRWGGGAVPTYN